MSDATVPQRIRSSWYWWLGCSIVVVLLGIIGTDYVIFHRRERQISDVAAQLGAVKTGRIGGWPIGEERLIVFSRSLTDDELEQLATLESIHKSKRFHIQVYFTKSSVSGSRLQEIRNGLHGIPVSIADSDRGK